MEVSSHDLYEVAFYLTLGADILNAEVVKVGSRETCRFTVSGENLVKAQLDYYNGTANVNLLSFRRCYTQLSGLIGTARKDAREKEKASKGGSL